MKTSSLILRDSTPADEPLLFRLFAENKAREFAALSLAEEQLQPLLAMQYRARCASYVSAHPAARQIIVEEGTRPVGQMLLSESEVSIHIVDIAVLPADQAKGLGTAVLMDLQERAAKEAKELRLEVVPDSPAARWYERMGFIVTGYSATSHQMIWIPKRNHNPSLG